MSAQTLLVLVGVPLLLLGTAELLYYPLAVSFELRRRRPAVFHHAWPTVTVVVPAYNEARVLANCVESVLADRYPFTELVLVDDGSTDDTLEVMRRYAHLPGVTVISRPNGGRAAALNSGLAAARGEILIFVDAGGIFTPLTIHEMLTGFDGPMVGAVCGNDEPANLDRAQTRLLALLTHGTAFARRALARIGCLTIVSGNCGAFRRSVLDHVGGFTEGFVGEDLELTWRVHRAGYQVSFRPRAIVYAKVPSTLDALWKQRVRWTRGHLRTARRHRDMMFTDRYGRVGWYLPVNVFAMLVAPVLQLAALAVLGWAAVALWLGGSGDAGSAAGGAASGPFPSGTLAVLGWLGLGQAVLAVCFAVALDRAWRDLRLLYLVPLLPLFSLLVCAVVAWSWILELRGAPAPWNELHRTGVVTRGTTAPAPSFSAATTTAPAPSGAGAWRPAARPAPPAPAAPAAAGTVALAVASAARAVAGTGVASTAGTTATAAAGTAAMAVGSGGSAAGSGGSMAGSGGSIAGSGGTVAGTGGTAAGSGGAVESGVAARVGRVVPSPVPRVAELGVVDGGVRRGVRPPWMAAGDESAPAVPVTAAAGGHGGPSGARSWPSTSDLLSEDPYRVPVAAPSSWPAPLAQPGPPAWPAPIRPTAPPVSSAPPVPTASSASTAPPVGTAPHGTPAAQDGHLQVPPPWRRSTVTPPSGPPANRRRRVGH